MPSIYMTEGGAARLYNTERQDSVALMQFLNELSSMLSQMWLDCLPPWYSWQWAWKMAKLYSIDAPTATDIQRISSRFLIKCMSKDLTSSFCPMPKYKCTIIGEYLWIMQKKYYSVLRQEMKYLSGGPKLTVHKSWRHIWGWWRRLKSLLTPRRFSRWDGSYYHCFIHRLHSH